MIRPLFWGAAQHPPAPQLTNRCLNNAPKPVHAVTLPQSKTTVMETLGVTSNVVGFITGVALLLSPLIAKKPLPVSRFLEAALSKVKLPLSEKNACRLKTALSDRGAIESGIRRATMMNGLLYACTLMETARDSKQPSMFASGVFTLITQSLGVIFPKSDLIWSAGWFRAMLYNAGKHTDLENYNHPDRRREWDIRRLNPFSLHHETPENGMAGMHYPHHRSSGLTQWFRELGSAGRFVFGDLRYSFSMAPWREFSAKYRLKDTWREPPPFLSALNAELNFGAWALTALGLATKKKIFSLLALPFMLVSDGIMNFLITSRALQNRQDMDGKLVLLGVPMAMVGLPFQPTITKRFFFLNGVCTMGGTLSGRGVMLNAKKQGYMVDAFKSVSQQAKDFPELTAGDVLKQFQSPRLQKSLLRRMGKRRAQLFMRTIEKADVASRTRNISFADYMKPIAESKK